MRFLLVLCCVSLFGFSMCHSRSSKEAEARAYQACLMMAANMISNKDTTLQGLSQSFNDGVPQGWESAKKEMDSLVRTPFISENADNEVRDLVSHFKSLPSDRRLDSKIQKKLDDDIYQAVRATTYWEACHKSNYDLVESCADKFEIDGADFKVCINPQGYFDRLPQRVSPFYKRYYEIYVPLIEDLSKEKMKEH